MRRKAMMAAVMVGMMAGAVAMVRAQDMDGAQGGGPWGVCGDAAGAG